MNSMRKIVAGAVTVGVVALVSQGAQAYTGPIMTCVPTGAALGQTVVATFKPGLTCAATNAKLGVTVSAKAANQLNGCSTIVPAATWTEWATAKVASKITATDAASITNVDVSLKGVTYGSCNFAGSTTTLSANAAGKLTFYAGAATKVKGGAAQFYGRVAGDGLTFSAATLGIITKGFAQGSKIAIQLPINGLDPANALWGFCNGAALPADCSNTDPFANPANLPLTALNLITTTNTYLEIFSGKPSDCTGAGVPLKCCTAAGAGGNCMGN